MRDAARREKNRDCRSADDRNPRGREFAACVSYRFHVRGEHPLDRVYVAGRQQLDEAAQDIVRARACRGRRRRPTELVRLDRAARAHMNNPNVAFGHAEDGADFGGRVIEGVSQQQDGALGGREGLECLQERERGALDEIVACLERPAFERRFE